MVFSQSMITPSASISLIGFGEAGSILGEELARRGCSVRAWDILLADASLQSRMRHRIALARADATGSLAEALRGAKLVISAVTATAAAQVARDSAPLLSAGQIFFDINSVSPGVKRASAALMEAAGVHYIDAAVMAPVPPQRLAVPMLLGGARAAELSPALNAMGFATRAVSAEVGVASAIKMCRSVMIKGIEALTVECLLAARHYGAEQAVLQSLAATLPGMGWAEAQPDYLISRVAEHGRRRAAEMREVAATVQGAGFAPHMSLATAARQDALVDDMQAAGITYDPVRAFSWRELADALMQQPAPRGELP
jgi:3-hydroxyisobutyrate dehydrogenase-like beta-hydroxyacid dehydrogenase